MKAYPFLFFLLSLLTSCGAGELVDDPARVTCESLGHECGEHDDGFGNVVTCPMCAEGDICLSGSCEPCSPSNCPDLQALCGRYSDGCGGTLFCGDCGHGQSCQDGACVEGECASHSCASLGYHCGGHSDGCGGWLECGRCDSGLSCRNGVCAEAECQRAICLDLGYQCGRYDDGCGGALECGACPVGEECVAGACVAECTPLSCSDPRVDCGMHDDGCGGTIDCGPCSVGTLTPGTSTLELVSAGHQRTVHLWVPDEVTAGPRPLLVALHGNGDTATNFVATTGLASAAAERGVILAAPQGITQSFTYHGHQIQNVSWDAYRNTSEGNIDLPMLSDLVSSLLDTGSVSSLRVYVFGYSQGGYMSFREGLARSPVYAAAVVTAAANPLPGSALVSGAARKIPIAITIGSNDWAVQNARASRDELVAAGHDVRYEEVAGAGHVPFPGNSAVLMDWLLERSL